MFFLVEKSQYLCFAQPNDVHMKQSYHYIEVNCIDLYGKRRLLITCYQSDHSGVPTLIIIHFVLIFRTILGLLALK